MIGRTAHPAEGFGGVRGLEVTLFGCRKFILQEFGGGNVIARKALEVLQVQADARSGHVRGVGLQEILTPVPGEGFGRGVAIGCDQHIEVGSDCLVVVDRGCETAEVVEQQKNPVAPGLKTVQSVLKAWKGLDLPEEFEVCPSDAVGIFGDNLDPDCPKEVSPEGHDVAARVERLGVRVQRDDGGVVLGKRGDECVFQSRLVHHLSFQTGCCPWWMVGRCASEGVVQDERPASGVFLVLPHPGRQLVQVKQPGGLRVAGESLVIEFRKLVLRIRSCRFLDFSIGR